MKPNIFIGSSTESLDIAYAIQESLEHDANPTVWTQGIFKLSNSILQDLLNALSTYHFAIFVLRPDDVTIIRESQVNVPRDNVIFELGLFMGKLGKEKVFFLVPREANNLHLPTDFLGINRGTYDNTRNDANLLAAVGPFANQVRQALKSFQYDNLEILKNESREAKRIAIEKPRAWEFLLFAELLNTRLEQTHFLYLDLETETNFVKSKTYSGVELYNWFQETLNDIKTFAQIFTNLFGRPFESAMGKPGEPGDTRNILYLADKFNSLCREVLKWGSNTDGMNVPEELSHITKFIKNWTMQAYDEIQILPAETKRVVAKRLSTPSSQDGETILVKIPPVTELAKFVDDFRDYLYKTGDLQ